MALDKSPLMNMTNFPADVWELHRKLFHRFLKYRKYFVKATRNLSEYKKAEDTDVKPEIIRTQPTPTDNPGHIINLLSTSEGEVSEDSEEETEDEEKEDV